MTIVALLALLLVPARAQIAPAFPEAPSMAGPVTPDNLDEVFRRFASGRPMIPTLKEVRAGQLKRDLAPRPGEADASAGCPAIFALENHAPRPELRREVRESVDVAASRPIPRLELGAGMRRTDVYRGDLYLAGETDKYAFLRVDLSKIPLARKLLHSPTAVHAQSEVGEKARVASDDYTTDFLKHPN